MIKLFSLEKEFKGYLVNNRVDLKKVCKELKQHDSLAFDTEGTSTLWYKNSLVGISISLGTRRTTWYIPVGHIADDMYSNRSEDIYRGLKPCEQLRIDVVIDSLQPIFENDEREIIFHNGKYDMHVLSRYGMWDFRNKRKIMRMNNLDTMIGMYLIDENTPNGLKPACKHYGIIDDVHEYNEIVATVPNDVKKAHGFKASQKATMDLVHTMIAGAYACDDAYGTFNLKSHVVKDLKKEGMLDRFYQLEMPYQRVLYLKEQRGMKIDVKKLKSMGKQIDKELQKMEYDIYEEVGHTFNMNAPQQLGKVLFEELGFPVIDKTKTGQPSIGKDTVNKLLDKKYKTKKMQKAQEILESIDDWRKLSKHKGSFVDGIIELLDENNMLHPSFKQHGTVTGRLSCSDPNIQQMPRPLDPNDEFPDIRARYDIRSCFIADNAKHQEVVASDYSNLELRIITHYSEEPSFKLAFDSGEDIHSRTAKDFLGVQIPVEKIKKEAPVQRTQAKIINFAIPYGTTAPTLAKQIGHGCTTEEAQEKLDGYFNQFKKITKFIKDTKKFAHKNGYTMTILGKKRRVKQDINDHRRWVVESAERQAVNAVIQGSGADIIKMAQIKIELDPVLEMWKITQRMQIHDELVFVGNRKYIKKAMKRISFIMGHPFGKGENDNLIVKLKAEPDHGMSWSEAK